MSLIIHIIIVLFFTVNAVQCKPFESYLIKGKLSCPTEERIKNVHFLINSTHVYVNIVKHSEFLLSFTDSGIYLITIQHPYCLFDEIVVKISENGESVFRYGNGIGDVLQGDIILKGQLKHEQNESNSIIFIIVFLCVVGAWRLWKKKSDGAGIFARVSEEATRV